MASTPGSQKITIMTPPAARSHWGMRLQHGMDAVISPNEAVLDLALPLTCSEIRISDVIVRSTLH